MTEPERRLLTSLFACLLFGYALLNTLVFNRRTRTRAERYRQQPLEGLVHSPRYSTMLLFSGLIGAIGFVVASWQLVLSVMAIMHGSG